jgi:hypothetical protein
MKLDKNTKILKIQSQVSVKAFGYVVSGAPTYLGKSQLSGTPSNLGFFHQEILAKVLQSHHCYPYPFFFQPPNLPSSQFTSSVGVGRCEEYDLASLV